ncbi:MAG: thioredoxin domain-containing protein [Ignavibacteriae bacterium]|nr:thioredoxin domain-containing protein [Ignavibacteriota bacterium]
MNKNKFENELIHEKSPYLLKHSHNPVNWFSWNEKAFAKAKSENKPIFLSIGYSTCHWCHVMEKESFEDVEAANLMNEVFVSIKVDREERPDIDNLYMSVCQMLTGHGGWPLTIIMTPDKKPFFAGTYFPKNSFGNRIGMIDLTNRINEVWKNQQNEIYESAEKITEHLKSYKNFNISDFTNQEIIETAFQEFRNRLDEEFGGFGDRPKFPSPHNLLFLLRYFEKSKNTDALFMVEKTLTEMRNGGIFDHIGFGFHRYSTDRNWLLPHFEKMLYDQAMLIIAYSETFQITKNPLYKNTAEEIITYVLRDLKSSNFGFYSAEDADSEGKEGKFYVWNKSEILKILGTEDGNNFCEIFNVTENGNYFEEASGKPTNTNIIHQKKYFDDSQINSHRTKLFLEREKRIHPFKDDKILTDWNGLMIAALAISGRIFENKEIINVAEKSIQFIFEELISENGNLLHRYRNGDSSISANIDDYAFLVWALIELYQSTFKIFYLQKSIEFTEKLIANFWDEENNSGFFFTDKNNSDLISRTKEFYDGAIPSGNSVMFNNLQKFYKITNDQKFKNYSEFLNKTYKQNVEKVPISFGHFLSGLNFQINSSQEIIIVGEKENSLTKEMLKTIRVNFLPNSIVILCDKNSHDFKLQNKIIPYLDNYEMLEDQTTAYVCQNYECSLPTNDLVKFKELLKLK